MGTRKADPPRSCGLTVVNAAVLFFILVVLAGALQSIAFRLLDPGTRRRLCTDNLRECAEALATYCCDYDGHLPSSAVVRNSKTWSKGDFTLFASGVGIYPPAMSWDTRRSPATWSQVLFDYMRNKDVMFCPRDGHDHNPPCEEAYDTSKHQVSYYWKAAIDKAWYGVGCKKPYRRASDFVWFADQIILYERCGFHCGAKRGLKNGVRINALYMDSHVERIAVTNSLPADGDKWATGPTAAGEPAYFNFDMDSDEGSRTPANVQTTFTDPSRYGDCLP